MKNKNKNSGKFTSLRFIANRERRAFSSKADNGMKTREGEREPN